MLRVDGVSAVTFPVLSTALPFHLLYGADQERQGFLETPAESGLESCVLWVLEGFRVLWESVFPVHTVP